MPWITEHLMDRIWGIKYNEDQWTLPIMTLWKTKFAFSLYEPSLLFPLSRVLVLGFSLLYGVTPLRQDRPRVSSRGIPRGRLNFLRFSTLNWFPPFENGCFSRQFPLRILVAFYYIVATFHVSLWKFSTLGIPCCKLNFKCFWLGWNQLQ